MKQQRILSCTLLTSLLLFTVPVMAHAKVDCSTSMDSTTVSRILVIIAETDTEGSNAEMDYLRVQATMAEISVVDVLMKEGLLVIDPGLVRQQLKRGRIQAILHGDERTAADVAQEFGARLMILGKASASVADGVNLYRMKSCQATVQARAINVTTGAVIATAFATSAKPHVDAMVGSKLAIQEAAQKVAKELIIKIRKEQRE